MSWAYGAVLNRLHFPHRALGLSLLLVSASIALQTFSVAAQTPSASVAPPASSLEATQVSTAWSWVERASWIVAIVGFPVALGVGIFQLGAIRRELTRRPDLRPAFGDPAGEFVTTTEITVEFRPRQTLSEPYELRVASFNYGARTANRLLFNYLFPQVIQPATPLGLPHADGRGSTGRDPDGKLNFTRQHHYLHPQSATADGLLIRIPAKVNGFDLLVAISMDDTPHKVTRLHANVRRVSATEA